MAWYLLVFCQEVSSHGVDLAMIGPGRVPLHLCAERIVNPHENAMSFQRYREVRVSPRIFCSDVRNFLRS